MRLTLVSTNELVFFVFGFLIFVVFLLLARVVAGDGTTVFKLAVVIFYYNLNKISQNSMVKLFSSLILATLSVGHAEWYNLPF